jgi:hypothetical protein
MALERTTGLIRNFVYYDAGGNPIAPFTPVSLLTSGFPSGYSVGQVVGLPTVTSGRNTTYLVGVTLEWAYSGKQVPVQLTGIVPVIANAAVAAPGILFVAATGTRTADQAPFSNLALLRPPVRPGQSVTLNVALVDDVAITPQSANPNVQYFPLGIALTSCSSQYELVDCLLQTEPFYA